MVEDVDVELVVGVVVVVLDDVDVLASVAPSSDVTAGSVKGSGSTSRSGVVSIGVA